METLDDIKGIDIYLLDQFLKDRMAKNSRILDAGCGGGRNLFWLLKNGYNVSAYDPKSASIENLKARFPKLKFKSGAIEDKPFGDEQFDFIICNAVLHFAKDHTHFHLMFESLVESLAQNAILFIRMTSNIGLENKIEIEENGRCRLPDLSDRYLISRKQIEDLCSYHSLKLIEPVKSLKVEDLRTMTTLVFQKVG
ncbi:MAG: tellurite methyltransferase [Arenicella sp.]|jgi:tellurite methyltransferase